MLVGFAVSWLALGFVQAFYEVLEFSQRTFQWAVIGILLGAASGMFVPYNLALGWVRRLADRIGTVKEAWASDGGEISVETDFAWTLTAWAGVLVSTAALLTPAVIRVADGVCQWAMENFLWMPGPLSVFDALLITFAAWLPFSTSGFLLRCVHGLSPSSDGWSVASSGSALVGVAVGILSSAVFSAPSILMLHVAGAVFVIVTVVAGIKATHEFQAVTATGDKQNQDLCEPEVGDLWPTVLRLALAVVVGCVVTAVMMWVQVADKLFAGSAKGVLLSSGALILAVGCGVHVSGRKVCTTEHGAGSFAVQCVMAGLCVAAGAAVFALVGRYGDDRFRPTLDGILLWLLCGCLPAAMGGCAAGHGSICILKRVTARPSGGARLLQLALVSTAVAAGGIAWMLLRTVGSYASLVAAALGLLACGGVLLIHDPSAQARPRHLRVAGVFTAVLVMTGLMPRVGGKRFAGPVSTSRVVKSPHLRAKSGASTLHLPTGGGGLQDGLRQLRASHERYDLLIIDLGDLPAGTVQRVLVASTIERAFNRLTPDGLLVAVDRGGVVFHQAKNPSILDAVSEKVAWISPQ